MSKFAARSVKAATLGLIDFTEPPAPTIITQPAPVPAASRGEDTKQESADARREAKRRRGRRQTVLSKRKGRAPAKLGRREVLGG